MGEKLNLNPEEEIKNKIKKDFEQGYKDFKGILENNPGLWEYIQKEEEKKKREEEDRRPQLEIPVPGKHETGDDCEIKKNQ